MNEYIYVSINIKWKYVFNEKLLSYLVRLYHPFRLIRTIHMFSFYVITACDRQPSAPSSNSVKYYPISEWIPDAPFLYTLNAKGGRNLVFNGFMYRKEASFKTSTNWVCNRAGTKDKCMARCVTRMDQSIRLGKYQHTHEPTSDLAKE